MHRDETKKDESPRRPEISVDPVREEEGGRPTALEGIVRNIAERKLARESILAERDRAESYLEVAGVLMVALDREGTVTMINRRGCEILGYPREEILGKDWFAHFLPQLFGAMVRGEFRRLIEGADREIQFFENPVLTSGGAERMISWQNRLLFDAEGRVVGTLSSGEDITERRRAEAAVEEERLRFFEVLEKMPAFVYLKAADHTIPFANRGFRDVFGDPEGKKCFEIMHGREKRCGECRTVRILESGESEVQEWTDGKGRVFLVHDHLFSGRGGEKLVLEVGTEITERKQVENALFESEWKHRRIFENASEGIVVAQDGFVKLANPKFEGFFEGKGKIYARPFVELVHPDDREMFLRADEARRRGEPVTENYAYRVVTGGGGIRWHETTGIGIEWEGRPATLSFHSDVTARRATEEELRKLKLISDHAGYGVAIADLDGNLAYVNESWARAHGYGPKELIGRNLVIFHRLEDLPRVEELNRQLVETGSYIAEEVLHVDREGRVFPMLMNGVLVRDEGGNPLYFGVTATDISALKEAKEERIRLATAIEQLADIVFILDLEGNVRYVNSALTTVTGFPREEAVGRDFAEYFETETTGEEEGGFRDALKSSGVWKRPLIGKKRGGRYDGQATFSPIRDEEGRVEQYVVSVRDVSAIIELERRLRQSQKMEAIGTLAGGIAHDFNNILYAILGFSELALEDAPPGSKCHECIEQVHDAGKRANKLVNRILSFSRQKEEERAPLQIQHVADETLGLLRGTLPATIEIRRRIDTRCPPVLANPTEIQQVVINLCTNASHAMKKNGGVLGLRVRARAIQEGTEAASLGLPSGSYVELDVTDSGCGMDEATRERIFDPYFTTKPVGEGTGMGLSTVHGIVAGLGGGIRVRSRPGRGSVFRVFFPALEEPAETPPVPEEAPEPAGGVTVLFVDDEPVLGILARSFLEGYGCAVETFTDPREALRRFREDPGRFDVIVTDQTMPDMTGADLARECRRIRPGVPVVLCSGSAPGAAAEEARSAGVLAFLRKPLGREDLARAVRRALRPAAVREG
ncbi:MAG: PAS domain S-box protein [Candidatus Eisenbacteria bacterium]